MWDKYRNKKEQSNKTSYVAPKPVAPAQQSVSSNTYGATVSNQTIISEIKKTIGTFPTQILRRSDEKLELNEIKVSGDGKVFDVKLLFYVYESNYSYDDDDAGEFYDTYMSMVNNAERTADQRLYSLKLQRHIYVNVEAKVEKTIYV